jgi:hypothetical protein
MIVLPVSILRPKKMIETNLEINCQGVSGNKGGAKPFRVLAGRIRSIKLHLGAACGPRKVSWHHPRKSKQRCMS